MSKHVEIQVPDGAKNIVVFVHGFGVRYDSRGMFTEIRESLPKNWGSVLFDFYNVDSNKTFVASFAEQVETLAKIIDSVKDKYPDGTLHIIAHSMGGIVAAVASPTTAGNVILLAPPESFGTKLEKYFSTLPGAQLQDNTLVVPRKDGTVTYIPKTFFKEMLDIDAEGSILQFSQKHPIYLLQTTADEVLGHTTYSQLQNNPNIKIESLPADHNFTAKNRQLLINYIHKILDITATTHKEHL